MVKGDYVEINGYNDCHNVGDASLAAAIIQRAVMNKSFCNPAVEKRAIWLAFENEACADQVREMFTENNFVVCDETNPAAAAAREDVDVPIFLLKGDMKTSLADSKVNDIAVLRFINVESYEKTLFALFAFYRRVRLNGYIITSSDYSSHIEAMESFFTDTKKPALVKRFCGSCPYADTNIDCNTRVEDMKKSRSMTFDEAVNLLLSQDFCQSQGYSTIQWFQKNDTQVRVPSDFRKREIVPLIDAKVTEAWGILNRWHQETVRRYFGHVGKNPYQTYRYIEATRHKIQSKQMQHPKNEARVNICETGFNGGHSAMLFLSFLDLENGITVHYYGWDLKQVGSSLPTATKMEQKFGDHFHITWGDSKETLKNVTEEMRGQKCDIIVVDGEHSKNGVINDLQNFLKVAEAGAIIFGDDCAPYKRTVPKSEEMLGGWNSFVSKGDVISVANYRNPDLGSPGFVEGIVPSKGRYTLGL